MAPTFFEWAYLGMAITGLGVFAIVVNWATNRTVPKVRREAAPGAPAGSHAVRA